MSDFDDLIEDLIDALEHGDTSKAAALIASNGKVLARQKTDTGATALHFAALHGQRDIARELVQLGADINSRDGRFAATPAGWAIEYLREMGAFLGIELADFAYAIETGDARWTRRFIERFPGLRDANYTNETSFRQFARESGNPDIIKLFEEEGEQ